MRSAIRRFRCPVVLVVVSALCALIGPGGVALAADSPGNLNGNEAVSAVTTAASGSGTITVGDDRAVSGSVTTTGVAGTAAHIHMAAAGKNGPVIIPLAKTGDNTWAIST